MASKVCFTDFHCAGDEGQLDKLKKLIIAAGIDDLDFDNKFVAVKVHFGEWGNMAFLRQQYAKIICDYVKTKGGKPFVTDCNTLYPGSRGNALDHLDAAYMNGYNPLATGVHTIIADGLRGNDEQEIPVEGGEYVKTAKIGAAIAEADVIISLNHFKGHVAAGFGGALKNIGMGCGSKRGKMEMHSHGTPWVDEDICIGCGMCVRNCANQGVEVIDGIAVVDEDKCVGCGHCLGFCPVGSIQCKYDEAPAVLNYKIAEYSKAVLEGKQEFHVSLVVDVSPKCDCDPNNDIPIIPDVGMFASKDAVAIDQACVDACNRMPVMPGSVIGEHSHHHHHSCGCTVDCPGSADEEQKETKRDVFRMVHPDTNWEAGLIHAEKLGIGTRDYELVTM